MSTHNIQFYGELTKIILQLSSNTLLICSSAVSDHCRMVFVELLVVILTLIKNWEMLKKRSRGINMTRRATSVTHYDMHIIYVCRVSNHTLNPCIFL